MVLHEAEQYARAVVEYLNAGGGIDEIDVAGQLPAAQETLATSTLSSPVPHARAAPHHPSAL